MHTRIKLMTLALLASALLAACGGASNEASATPATGFDVPDEAQASPEAFTNWAKSLSPNDSTEPLNMGHLVTAPSSETAEAAPLN